MEKIFELLMWYAAGVIFLFIFLVGLNRSMRKDARKREEKSGDSTRESDHEERE